MLEPEPIRFREGKPVRNWPLEALRAYGNKADITGRRRRQELAPQVFWALATVLEIHYPHALHAGARVVCPRCRTPHPCQTVTSVIRVLSLQDPLDPPSRRYTR